MQITRAGEYGVLGLMNLARRAPGEMAMIEEVSRMEKIPGSFLAKIFQHLAKAGLVRSNRGAHGGFALARNPAQITVLEIIEAIEGKIIFQRCKLAKPVCEHVGGCAVCGLFEQAQDGVKDVAGPHQPARPGEPRKRPRPRRLPPPAAAAPRPGGARAAHDSGPGSLQSHRAGSFPEPAQRGRCARGRRAGPGRPTRLRRHHAAEPSRSRTAESWTPGSEPWAARPPSPVPAWRPNCSKEGPSRRRAIFPIRKSSRRWADCRPPKSNAPSWPPRPCGPRWKITRNSHPARAPPRPARCNLARLCATSIWTTNPPPPFCRRSWRR